MSKRDIQTVCELAAHLATKHALNFTFNTITGQLTHEAWSKQAAADAMALQRLGRRARNMETKRCNVPGYYSEEYHGCKYNGECKRIADRLREILAPYGLKGYAGGDPRGYCLHILGLPGNTMGGEGFGI